MSNLLYIFLVLPFFVAHAEADLCLPTTIRPVSLLGEKVQEIMSAIDPELNSQCQGLIAKRLLKEEADVMSSADFVENEKLRMSQATVSPYATSKEQYCTRTARDMIRNFCMPKGKLGLDNTGGIFGLSTGVCWWNSIFHRQMNYLTYYNPNKPSNYSDQDALEIIKRIAENKVTPIDGYENFQDFIKDSKFPKRTKILQKYLQKEMGKSTLRFDWLKGFKGKGNVARKNKVNPKQLEKQRGQQLEEITKIKEQLINQGKVPYVMVQVPGLGAHSFLVYDFIEFKDFQGNTAYKIRAQDSIYQNGETVYQEDDFIFDSVSGQWYDHRNYPKLIQSRKDPSSIDPKEIEAQKWTLFNDHNDDMDPIDEGFRQECGHSLFK